MEKIILSFYSHAPRLVVELTMNVHTVPVVGDEIHIPSNGIILISEKIIDWEIIEVHGMDFRVEKRTKYIGSKLKEDWRIYLIPLKPIKTKR